MINRIFSAIIVLGIMVLSVSCDKESAVVSGRLTGADSQMIILEQVTAQGAVKLDSTKTDGRGAFKLRVKLADKNPTFYNLCIEGNKIPMFVSPGENIKITSQYGQPGKYNVVGSRESILVKELNDVLVCGSRKLDSLAVKLSGCTSKCPEKEEYIKAYLSEYGKLKREQIKFIITNSGSLASLYALYQRLPNDRTLFDGNNDMLYYRLVADSVSKYYPTSPYLEALKSEIDFADSRRELSDMVSQGMNNRASYPDILLPDMVGKLRKMSDNAGNVILLDFWSAATVGSSINNAELKAIYSEFATAGFEIYQVSVDTSKPLWVNAVRAQALPWVSVCDFNGIDGIAPRMYNVGGVPANYLIGRDGEIEGKNMPLDKLRDKIKELVVNR